MRNDAFASKSTDGLAGLESSRWRTGRPRFAFRNHRGIGLLLAVVAFVPWLPTSGRAPASHPAYRAVGQSRTPIVSLAFGPDGGSLATTDEMGLVTLWKSDGDWSPDRSLAVCGHARPIDFSPDGRHVAIGGDEPGVALWDLERRSQRGFVRLPFDLTLDLKISPDGRTLAASGSDSPEIVLWDLDTGRERITLRGHSAPAIHLVFAPDGRSLASAAGTAADRHILIWDLNTGRPRIRLTEMSSAQLSIAYSPDGRLMAGAGAGERPVRIWDVETGRQLRVIEGHSTPTRALAFSPDGRMLATAAGDGTAALWSVATGGEIRRLDGHSDVLRNIAFTPDGKMLAATGNDGDVRFWVVDDLIGSAADR